MKTQIEEHFIFTHWFTNLVLMIIIKAKVRG